jgi:hypothetical protein
MTRDEALAFVALYGDGTCDLIKAAQPAEHRSWWRRLRGK